DGHDLGARRLDREVRAGARGPPDAEREPGAGPEVAEGLDELEHDLVVLDRVDEPVAEAVPDPEELLEPREPRPALGRRAAGEVRGVDGRTAGGELAEPDEPRRRQRFHARQ